MVALLNLQVLPIFLFLVAPGVVASTVYSYLVPSERRKLADYLVEVVTFSMVYLALFFWLLALLYNAYLQSNILLLVVLTLLTAFILPAFLGWLVSYLLQTRSLRRFVKSSIHPMPTAWDYIFSRGRPYWIIFHLKTGERVGGYYGRDSFASSYPDTQEIYIEELWRLDANGILDEENPDTAGGFIKVEDCKFIEFLKGE